MDVSWNVNQSLSYLSDYELCHFTSKPISNKEDTLKSFIDFDITSCGPVFRVVVGSQIVIPQQYLSEEKKNLFHFFTHEFIIELKHMLLSNYIITRAKFLILSNLMLKFEKETKITREEKEKLKWIKIYKRRRRRRMQNTRSLEI